MRPWQAETSCLPGQHCACIEKTTAQRASWLTLELHMGGVGVPTVGVASPVGTPLLPPFTPQLEENGAGDGGAVL